MEKTLSTIINNFDDLATTSNHFGIEINNNQLDLFKKYYTFLVEWNKKINLVSRGIIGNTTLLLEKHFLDSIIFLPEIENLCKQKKIKVFDIGSGGGFPAIPLAIMKPDWEFVLCESTKKKTVFLTELIKELGLNKSIIVLNDRSENISKQKSYQNAFDIVTARAVSKLNELINCSLPLINSAGHLIFYKSKDIESEIENAETLIKNNRLKLSIFSKEINTVERKLIVLSH